jgi:DNA-binding NtrC family response regulator
VEPESLELERWFRRFLEGRGDTIDPLLFCLRGGRAARPEIRARAALITSRIFLVKGCVDLAHAYLNLSATLFRRSAAGVVPSGLLVNRALILKARGRPREAAALLGRTLDRALKRGETLAAAKAAANLALCLARAGPGDRGARQSEATLRVVGGNPMPTRGDGLRTRGEDPLQLLFLAERTYRALGNEEGLIRLGLTRGLLEATHHSFDEGVERIVRTLHRCEPERYERERIIGRLLLAEIFLFRNDCARARWALDAVASSGQPLGRFGPQRAGWLALEHEWHRRAGDERAAAEYLAMAEETRRRLGLAPGEPIPQYRSARVFHSVAREARCEPPPRVVRPPGETGERFLTADARTTAVLAEVARAARLAVPILITGESGVGKELVARSVHRWSGRAGEPFVAVNVAALPAELFESILFGHERGAFTGALARTPGLLESAGRGTIFLDEIGELAPALQAKLLRLIDRGEFIPVGRSRECRIAARIVAATNRDLAAARAAGSFRTDLYYRIAVFVARIPPLRERRTDIPMLARCLLERACARFGLGSKELGDETLELLARYDWPGNVRELEGEILGATLRAKGPVIRISHFSPPLVMALTVGTGRPARDLPAKVALLERTEIMEALRASGGSCAGAASILGLRRTTLIGKMKRLGIER